MILSLFVICLMLFKFNYYRDVMSISMFVETFATKQDGINMTENFYTTLNF